MLILNVGATEGYDESSSQFVEQGGIGIELEHSLLSVSKWESIWEKPFLAKTEKTPEEVISYVLCMALDSYISPEVFQQLSQANFESINTYINAKKTATWFSESGAPQTREIVTSELIYYWMTVFQIPFSAESWHLNRLFTLIRICNIKQAKPKKMSKSEMAARNRELNAQRRQQMGTKG